MLMPVEIILLDVFPAVSNKMHMSWTSVKIVSDYKIAV